MRSELVFAAVEQVPNRFLLTKLAASAARKFHRPNTRVEETVNDVLVRFRDVNRVPWARKSGNLQMNRQRESAPSRYIDRTPAVA